DIDDVTYSANDLPVGASLDASTGEFTWTPDYNDSGVHVVDFIASSNGLTDSETITITVNNVDRAPILDPVGNKEVNETELLSFTISATDPEDDDVTYSANDLPVGASLDASTGEFTWTPDYNDSGVHVVDFIASSNGLIDSETITITVNNVDRAPILDPIGNKEVDETELLSFTISATDPEDDDVTYSANDLPVGASLDASTGEFTWTPDYNDSGVHVVDFIASSNGLTDSESITITVADVNRPPIIEPIPDKLVNEKEELIIHLNATDDDGDDLYYSKNVGFGTLDDNVFSWTPDYNESGLYDVDFTVSDGHVSSIESVRIAVGKTNRPPVLDQIGGKSVNEAETLSFSITASDPNPGDVLSYYASGLPPGASFDPVTCTFQWLPSYEQSGSYNVLFEVSDGIYKDTELITIVVNNVNRPPVLSPIDDKIVNEGYELRFTIAGTDPDQTTLSYYATGLPSGSSFNGVTREFIWIPTYEDSGTYNVTFNVSDGSLSDSQTISISVVHVNRPPELNTIGNKAVDPGSELMFVISGNDPDSDLLTYSATGVPVGAKFNANTREFTWTPDYADYGTYNVIFTIGDGSLSDSETVLINVGYINRAPVLEPIGDKSVDEGSELRFTISGSDPDSDTLTYSATNLPPGASFDVGAREFVWTPGYEASGIYSVTVSVSDGFLSDSETISIFVANINRQPLLNDIGNKAVDEGSTLRFTISGSDPDSDQLSYSIKFLPSGASFNGNTKEFDWTPDYDRAGTYSVTFTVSDGSLSDIETIVITVKNVNRAPVLDTIGNKAVNENSELLFSISGSDPDSDQLIYSASNLPDGAIFNQNTRQFRWKPDYDSSGVHIVYFHVSDGKLSDSETIIITVNNVNRAPILESIGNRAVNEGNELSFTVSASDPDSDQLTYTAIGLPAGSNFNVNTRKFFWTPGYDDAGTYIVTFRVSDGSLTDSETISISVGSVNRAPEIYPIGDRTVDEGSILSFIVSASDPDLDQLSYSATGMPAGSSFNANTREFTWAPGYDDSGIFSITLTVSDGSLSDSETISINVVHVNRPPVLMVIGSRIIDENEALTITMIASDDDDDTLYYSVYDLPEGSQIDESAGVFTWTPTYEQTGSYQVKFIVSDGLAEDTEDVKVTVNDVNRPPVFDLPAQINVAENTALFLRLNASDPDGDYLSYSTGVSFGSLQGDVFTWTPGYEDEGIYTVLFTVDDGEFEISKTSIINVTNSNSAPVLYSISDTLVNELETVIIELEAVDIDGDELIFFKDVDYGNLDDKVFTWIPDINDSGFHRITFTVSDGELSDSKIATIAVGNTNIPPVIMPMKTQHVRENEAITFIVNASDRDNEPLTYNASGLPLGSHLESTTGIFTWTPTYDQSGTYTVEFRVSDKIYTAIDTVIINVENVNRAPVFDSIPIHAVNETETLRINLSAADQDGDWVSFSTTFGSGKVTGNVFTWTPGYYDSGDYYIEFNVTDGSLTDTTTVHVKVAQTNMPPEIEAIGSYSLYENETLQFFVNATDGDNDSLAYSALGVPKGASFDPSTRQFTWKPDYTQSGTYSIEFRVSDGELNVSEAVSIRVYNVDMSPNTDLSGFPTSDSSSGSGGGASSGAEDYNNVAFKDYSIKYVTMGKDIVFEFPNADNDIEYVKFSPLKAAAQVKAIIEILKDRSTLVSSNPPENVYRHINIWVGDTKFNSGGYISSAEISFKVKKKWLTENNADPLSTKLYRYSDGSWKELQTSRIGSDVNYYYYKAQTPGFSPFAIVSTGSTPVAVSTEVSTSTAAERLKFSSDSESTLNSINTDPDAFARNAALQPSPAEPFNATIFFIGIIGILAIGSVLGYRSRHESVVLSRYYNITNVFLVGIKNAAEWVKYKFSSDSIHKDYAVLSEKWQEVKTADYRSIYEKKVAEIKERQKY
ncbi:putative Ig domain-containing protein, partial [Methanolobus psychrotolerans]|uniref:putative Ig domain-containing protein n=1 Tax=Methanolobus psychrotolerans TaxID=1874706 RepID=UPI00101ADB20